MYDNCYDCALPATVCAECQFKPSLKGEQLSDKEKERIAEIKREISKPLKQVYLGEILLVSTPIGPGTGATDEWLHGKFLNEKDGE